MYQQKKQWCVLHAKLFKLFVGGALLLAVSPAYAAGDNYSGTDSTHSSLIVHQNGRTITGTVIDETGETVIGANVVVKGTTNGSITDVDGRFSLNNVPDGAILIVSYVGYEDLSVKVGVQSQLTIKLKESSELIDEVVVVGYASQKKVNLSGSVASVNMDDISEKRPITNLSSGLAGMAAGVSVTSSSNKPGEDNTSIMIRGQGTLNSSSPLVIIDGVESNINTVAPQDVESMIVLKDAASASIYGSRAANGVILITTKKGKSGKINIDYTGYAAIQSIGHTIDAVTNYADYMSLKNEAAKNSNRAGQYDPQMIEDWRADNGRNPLLYPNTDWVDEVFKSALATNHNLSLSGGSEKVTFYTSFGYNDNPGVMENSGYQRYSFRSNVEAKPLKWLTLGMKLGGYLSNREIGSGQISNVFTYGSAGTPGIVYRAPDGRYGGAQALGEDIQLDNPLVYLNSRDGNYKRRNFRSTFNGAITPLEGLTITGSYTYELTDDDNWEKPVYHDQWDFLHEQIVKHNTGRTWISNFNGKQERMFMDATIRYEDKVLNNRFSFSILAGASQELFRSYNMTAKKYDWTDESMDVINGFTGDAEASGSRSEWAMRSYFGRINLGWDDKYLVEVNLRADASSRFLKENRWGYFPSVSAAWRVDQENFMESTRGWLDAFKLRVSYGELGNNSVGNYDAVSTYNDVMYGLGQQAQLGMTISSLANGGLTWESTAITNVAVDFGTLQNRLTGTLEYFYKNTKDILISLPAPLVHGNAGIPKQNSARVRNQGFELTLNWQDKINDDFHYSIGTNVTFVDNKVTNYKNGEMADYGSYFIQEGSPINQGYVLKVDRIIQTQEDLDYVEELSKKYKEITDENGNVTGRKDYFQTYKRPELGDVLYKDMNGDGTLDDNDRIKRGHGTAPRFFYDINVGFEYKGFDFSMLMSGTGNYYVQYQNMHTTNLAVSGYQIGQEIADGRWYEGRETPAKYPRLLINDSRNTRASDLWESNKRFFKIRNIQLGYSLPQRWLKPVLLSRARVFCSLENFFTFTDYQGLDPETSGINYPTMRQASFGVNVSF